MSKKQSGGKAPLADENKFTRVPNHILEALIKMPFKGSELAVALFIIRKTYGWHKLEDEISLSQFELALCKAKGTIVTAQKNLQTTNVITLLNKGKSKRSSNLWKFNEDIETWKPVNTVELVKRKQSTSLIDQPQPVDTVRHTKEKITKENEQKKSGSGLPTRGKNFQEEKLKTGPAALPNLLATLEYDEALLCRALMDRGCYIPDDFLSVMDSLRDRYHIDRFSDIADDIKTWSGTSTNATSILKGFCKNYKIECYGVYTEEEIIKMNKDFPSKMKECEKISGRMSKEEILLWHSYGATDEERQKLCDDVAEKDTYLTKEKADALERECKIKVNKKILFDLN